MKVSAVYATNDPPKKEHPRKNLDEALMKNYPGKDLHDLDKHNVPVYPGKPDTPAMAALRKGHKPSVTTVTTVKK